MSRNAPAPPRGCFHSPLRGTKSGAFTKGQQGNLRGAVQADGDKEDPQPSADIGSPFPVTDQAGPVFLPERRRQVRGAYPKEHDLAAVGVPGEDTVNPAPAQLYVFIHVRIMREKDPAGVLWNTVKGPGQIV